MSSTGAAAPRLLVDCRSTDEYRRVGGHGDPGVLPVFTADGTPPRPPALGFPAGVETVPFDLWSPTATPAATAPGSGMAPAEPRGSVCIAAPEPRCRAAAELLAARTARRALPADDDAHWEHLLRTDPPTPPGSITLVIPAWDGDGDRPDPDWLRRALDAMRDLDAAGHDVPWGMLTGTSPRVLSLQVAKAIWHDRIVEAYRGEGSLFLTDSDAGQLGLPLPHHADGDPPFVLGDMASLQDGSAATLVGQRWDALVVRTHARNYCGLHGHLCGARPVEADPAAAPRSCVSGMACYDPAWPQIDPRRYDTPVVVYDSCSTANWASPMWEEGTPALAHLTLAGPAAAVIATTGPTLSPTDRWADPVVALASAATLGEATSRLNAYRRPFGLAHTYFLFGDPDAAAGPDRWGDWAQRVELDAAWSAEVTTTTAPLLCAPVAVAAGDEAVLVVNTGVRSGPPPWVERFEYDGGVELWTQPPTAAGSTATVRVERVEVPELPRGLEEAALGVEAWTHGWCEPLAATRGDLLDAATAIHARARLLEQVRGRVGSGDPRFFDRLVAGTVGQWQAAQLRCVAAAGGLADAGLWALSLWRGRPEVAEVVDDPCPACGLAPSLRRPYQVGPGAVRRWWECERCGDIIDDLPLLDGYPALTLDAPRRIHPGEEIVARLGLDQRDGHTDCIGAALVLVDMPVDVHGVRASDPVFPVAVRAGAVASHDVTLRLDDPPPRAHLFRIRALAMLNGRWFWASRLLQVAPDGS